MELRTERLLMRPASAADVEDLILLHEDPLVRETFGTPTRAEIEEWVGAGGGRVGRARLRPRRPSSIPRAAPSSAAAD